MQHFSILFTGFTLHLRECIGSTHQYLLDYVLNQINLLQLDIKGILEHEEAGLGSPILDSLLSVYTNIYTQLTESNCPHSIKNQFIACLISNLSLALFNLILENDNLINITTGLKLQVIHSSIEEYAIRTSGNSLLSAIQPQIIRLKQLALFFLMDKSSITTQQLTSTCPNLTTLQLCHILKHYSGN